MTIKILRGDEKETLKKQFLSECHKDYEPLSFPQRDNFGNELQIHETEYKRIYFRLIMNMDINTYCLRKYYDPQYYEKAILSKGEFNELFTIYKT
ncbi:MAG: hypothetical protein AABY22_09300 [Nanoarchaeota archaeon]